MSTLETSAARPEGSALHVGIAEQGKLHAIDGRHGEALRHYREAMRLAVQGDAPDVFFRHYTQCVLESLEAMEAWDEILEFCDRAEAHYEHNPPPNPLARLDLASIRERRAVVLLHREQIELAREALEQALNDLPPTALPLARTLHRWLGSGLRVDPRRLRQEQVRHHYFVVRREGVDPRRAIPLPPQLGSPMRRG
ncbi:MAG: peptidylprolyl isomerase [Nannocystaceae bacterium]